MTKIYVYDTTLRDGSQGEGISLSVDDKLKIAARLDELGVDYVEGGWPGSNPKDMEFFQQARQMRWQRARLAGFCRTCKPGQPAATDENLQAVLASGVPVATIVAKSWDLHVRQALGTDLPENLRMINASVRFFKERGLEVVLDAEHFFDGFKADPAYALETLRAAAAAGADWLVLCDTNGGSLPDEIVAAIRRVQAEVKLPLGIHTHNDSELAVANTLAAVKAGCTQVQGTMNGYGERCGNANLCTMLPSLELKMGCQCLPPGRLATLTEAARFVAEIANVALPNNMAYVGNSAFAHKGGIHVSAVLKESSTYEHINPEAVGNGRRVLVSELAGASNLLYKAQERGLTLANGNVAAIIQRVKDLEHQGYQFEGAEASLELLIKKASGQYEKLFDIQCYKILVEQRKDEEAVSEAIIKLKVGDQVVHTAAEGNGPVNALDNALRKALEAIYPAIGRLRLTDYKVRVLDEKSATGAKVRVLVESRLGGEAWSTVGVSANIIEASWQALLDSMDYALQGKKGGGD